MYIPAFVSSFPSFSLSISLPFSLVARFVGFFSFSFNTLACLLFAVDDRVTLPSLDIGVGRAVTFVVLVRVTPLGPAFAVVERNLEAFVDFAAGNLDGSGVCSFTFALPSPPDSAVSGTGSGGGATASVVVGVVIGGINSDESCFSSGCVSAIVGATGGTGSGAGLFEVSEVEGSSGYGSAGMGGSTEADLDLAMRWEGGVGDLEGNENGSGLVCGGIRWEGRSIRSGLGPGFDCDGDFGCGCS